MATDWPAVKEPPPTVVPAASIIADSRERRTTFGLRAEVVNVNNFKLRPTEDELREQRAAQQAAVSLKEQLETLNTDVINSICAEVVGRHERVHERQDDKGVLAHEQNAERIKSQIHLELRKRLKPAEVQKQIDERRSEIKRDVNAERIAASAPVDEISDREIASLYAELNSARTRRTGDWASQKGDMVAASDAANAARAAAVKAAKAVLRSAREAQGIDVEAEDNASNTLNNTEDALKQPISCRKHPTERRTVPKTY